MNSKEFRKELLKLMPGYKWTVHRTEPYLQEIKDGVQRLTATGIQTAGYNRLSTLRVHRRESDNGVKYEVKSSGFGKNAPWLSNYSDKTLARALRGLQDIYNRKAADYSAHAWALERGRKK